MITHFFVSFLFLFFSPAAEQDHALAPATNCEQFKYGQYILADTTIDFSSTIERVGKYQIETNDATGEVAKFKIKWINECEYTLKMVSGPKALKQFVGRKKLYVKIVETEEDRYKFEAVLEGRNRVETQWMQRIDN